MQTISRPTTSISDDLKPELRFENGKLVLELRAFRKLRVIELQGSRSLIDAFDAMKPRNFQTRKFGDDADVPPELMKDAAFINRSQFRWACDIPIADGDTTVVLIPCKATEAPTLDLSIISVVYEYTKFLGLVRRKFAATIAVGDRKNRAINPGRSNA